MYIEFYNRSCDIVQDQTESMLDANHIAGDLIDAGFTDDIKVLVYNNEGDATPIKELKLHDFLQDPISKHQPEPVRNKEVYHNLDHDEQLEVLKFVPDRVLIDEIMRRFDEYRSATDDIAKALDEMKIYR